MGGLTLRSVIWTGIVAMGLNAAPLPSDLEPPMRVLKSVGPEGKGNAEAAAAWKALSAANVSAVTGLLASMDGANDYALNWLRAAVESVIQREAAAAHPVSISEMEAFLRDTHHHPRARRLAFELVRRGNPNRAATILPEFLNDPGIEMRRDAVTQLADEAAARAAAGDKAGAVERYRRALGYAREADQIDGLAQKLGPLGDKVELRETLGWVTRWKVVGPFDNSAGSGFTRVFPPEESVEMADEYDGKGAKVRWQDLETRDDYGRLDFNLPYTPLKEVTGYARNEFWSETDRPAEIRLGCKNGWKVWLNGEFIFGRDEYHRNMEMDQYRLPVRLKAGRNVLLVKCCQNEQTEDWTKEWEFQLRMTDAEGTPIRSTR